MGPILLPLFAAMLHPFLGWCVQQAHRRGAGMFVVACLANLLSLVVFAVYLRPSGEWSLVAWDWLAVLNGVFFFSGQWFSLLSIRHGDLAVHSSVLGVKIFLVAMLSALAGLESFGLFLGLAVALAVASIFLVAGATWKGLRQHRETVVLTTWAALFFALVDFCTGWKGQTVGTGRFLLLMMGTNGLLSLAFLITRFAGFRELIGGGNQHDLARTARWFVLAAGLALGVQALLINLALSWYGKPALTNVVYGLRAVMALLWLWAFGQWVDRQQPVRRLVGCVLMVLALWLAFRGGYDHFQS